MADLTEETIISLLQDKENCESSSDVSLENSPLKNDNLSNNLSSEDEGVVKSVKRRIKRFSDSDSEIDKENKRVTPEKEIEPSSESDHDIFPRKRLVTNGSSDGNTSPSKSRLVTNNSSDDNMSPSKSRLVTNNSSDDNTSPSKSRLVTNGSSDVNTSPIKSRLVTNNSSDDNTSPKNESARISDRRSKLHKKFKLLKSRSKARPTNSPTKSSRDSDGNSSDGSNSGTESIKQKIKQKSILLKYGICDPDTSSDEDRRPIGEKKKSKPRQKSTILTSPKPVSKPARISAKQAMENMQKIKSESNRMLREKEVTLPYHRPKALSLKDIMNRRKPALSADGKALPVKMNSDQLKQYVKLLEVRNKEMMELCKSESEEEEETNETKTDDNKEHDVQSSILNDKEATSTNDNETLDSLANTHNENEETPNNDTKEREPYTKTSDCQELTENIVEKRDENFKPGPNAMEETNEDDLPDLMVEVVQKEQNMANNIVKQRDENSMPSPNEDDLPDLMVEVVQKEQNISNIDITEKHEDVDMKDVSDHNIMEVETNPKLAAEVESQLIQLRYETEKIQNTEELENYQNVPNKKENEHATSDDKNHKTVPDMDNNTVGNKSIHESSKDNSHEFNDDFGDDFSDVDINMEDLESIIENAKNDETAVDSPVLIRDPYNLNKKPKLTGAPGMVIDLHGSNPVGPRKLTGVELLKERFTYFANLKTPEEKERERELKIKPGMQHLKLKHELEEKISEQRSLEWAKRLEEEKQQHDEMNAIRGDESDGDDLEKIEAKLQEKEDIVKESSSESEEEEEEEEETCKVKENPRKKNPMIDDEAEVSDDEEAGEREEDEEQANEGEGNENATEDANDEADDEDSEESSDESSDDEIENQSKPRKGRILKAFEDSDDETTVNDNSTAVDKSDLNVFTNTPSDSQAIKDTQDDVLPLAQVNKSISEDLFGSQTSSIAPSSHPNNTNGATIRNSGEDCADMTTQTFSILNTNNTQHENKTENILHIPANIDVICESQPIDDGNLDDALALSSGKFTQTQNIIPAQSQIPESQCGFGEDILALCTGKFYDNEFVSQAGGHENDVLTKENTTDVAEKPPSKKREEEKDLLDSILQEIDEPVDKDPHKKKYMFDNPTENEAVSFEVVNQVRKKFTIDSEDESNVNDNKPAKKKKLKKRKLEQRALQISDDEEEEELLQSDEEAVEYMSGVEDNGGVERIVEYDSEENEVEVKPLKQKKGRKMAEFFEQEAELTSEDEWAGSGDEDERGLDRMEREEGDDDTFHQGQLQRELGQIHMRDVLDQDKREVRIIQELLFEDGDLGDGGRQRRFRWNNLDGEDEPGAVPELFAESQEDEFESEEQWRKQRHEREVFLRNLKENEKEDRNISIDRSSIIKANLCSKTMSSLLLEVNGAKIEETTVLVEKKTKEEPSRKLPLPQNYHGSLLTRGRGALARLAALAMPLAGEAHDDSKVGAAGPSSKRNFVFATLTPPAKDAKAPKRKAEEVNTGTPRLLKKLKTDDNKKMSKTSLLDHLKAL